MYATSDAYRAAVRGSHRATLRCEVWRDGQKIATVYPVSGRVDADSRRAIRRTCSLEFIADRGIEIVTPVYSTYADLGGRYATYAALPGSYGGLREVVSVETSTTYDPLIPGDSATDPLSPYGNEIRVWRGVEVTTSTAASYGTLSGTYSTYAAFGSAFATYGGVSLPPVVDTSAEEIPLGVFIITEVDMADQGAEVRVSVQAEDRALRISRNRWTAPYVISDGTNVVTAVTDLLQNRWDDVTVVASASVETVGRAVLGQETGNDPWADARKIADSAGLDLFFDGEGNVRLEPVPSIEDASPDATYREGADAVVLSVSRRLDAKTTYNGVIVTGEGTSSDTPARGEAWDDDPASPTYRYGPFGEVPFFYSSPLVTTDDQAASAASARLRKVTGLTEGVEWSMICDPSLEPGDVVDLTNVATRTAKVMVLDSISIPLDVSAAMSAVGRTVKAVDDAA